MPDEEMRTCTGCGRQIPAAYNVCPNCGKAVNAMPQNGPQPAYGPQPIPQQTSPVTVGGVLTFLLYLGFIFCVPDWNNDWRIMARFGCGHRKAAYRKELLDSRNNRNRNRGSPDNSDYSRHKRTCDNKLDFSKPIFFFPVLETWMKIFLFTRIHNVNPIP